MKELSYPQLDPTELRQHHLHVHEHHDDSHDQLVHVLEHCRRTDVTKAVREEEGHQLIGSITKS